MPGNSFVIGYAIPAKKERSLVTPTLVDLLKGKNIDVVSIHRNLPLLEQGQFDAVIQKFYDEEWIKQLDAYGKKYPKTLIIDKPEFIQRLFYRSSMLQAVENLHISDNQVTFGIPVQYVIDNSEELVGLIEKDALKYPLVVKPLVCDGSPLSHTLSLVFNKEGLLGRNENVVLQEFVNHGGVVFKIYVAGEFVMCVKRKSLPDFSEDNMAHFGSSVLFSQISNTAIDESLDETLLHAELPPQNFILDLAKGLRSELQLNLFNIDLIRDSKDQNKYYIIDINYMPGYGKLLGYEEFMVKFLTYLAEHKNQKLEY